MYSRAIWCRTKTNVPNLANTIQKPYSFPQMFFLENPKKQKKNLCEGYYKPQFFIFYFFHFNDISHLK
jgi:hypothetical protein